MMAVDNFIRPIFYYRFSMIFLKLATAGFTATSCAVSYKGMVTMVTIGNYIDSKVELKSILGTYTRL